MARYSLLEAIASAEALRSGFERVWNNRGSGGADGVGLMTFRRRLDDELLDLGRELRSGAYRPLPLLRMLVEKKDGEARELCIPAIRDRVAQSAGLDVLGPLFEAEFEPCSYGFRRGRSVRDAVRVVRRSYEAGYRWIYEADIDAYFAKVDHDLLLARVDALVPDKRVVKLLARWIKAWVWDGSQVYRLKRGLPQGSVISPALANLLLDGLDEAMLAARQHLVRYADDFIVVCKGRSEAEAAAKLTDQVMDSLHLNLDEAKITTFDDGFRFLGVTFVRSLALVPLETEKREMRVLFAPPPMNPEQLQRWKG